MLRRLRSLGLAMLIAGSAAGTFFAAEVLALGVNCPADTSGPLLFLDDNPRATYVQVTVIAHCGIKRESKLWLELRRNGVLIDSRAVTCTTSAGCNTNYIVAVASRKCVGTTSATFTARWMTKPEDKFEAGPWVNLPARTLSCSV